MQNIASGANPALELAMQELEPMDAPTWKTAIVSATAVSVGVSIGITIT
ncbi:daptide-type RiPP [Sphaerimonospora mesophila]